MRSSSIYPVSCVKSGVSSGDENEMLCEQTRITEWRLQFRIKSFARFLRLFQGSNQKHISFVFAELVVYQLFSMLVLHFLLLEEENLFRM